LISLREALDETNGPAGFTGGCYEIFSGGSGGARRVHTGKVTMKPDKNAFLRWMKTVVPVALLALLAGGTWFYRVQEQTMRETVEMNLTETARLKTDQITAWREERLGDAGILQENPSVARSVARLLSDPQDGNAGELRALFSSLRKHYHYDDVLLVDPDGQVILSLSGKPEILSGYAAALAVALRERRPGFTALHREEQHPSSHISVIAPLFSGDEDLQRPLGAIILISDASRYLYPLIQSWPTRSKTAETLLVTRDGEDVLFLNDLRHQADTALKLRIPLTRTEVPAVMAVLGWRGLVTGRDYRGVEVVAVVRPVAGSDWFMVAKIDAAEAYAEWHFRSALILFLLAGFGGITLLSGLVVWQGEKKKHYRAMYRSEAALRAAEERHVTTMKSIGDAVIATDALGRVEMLNHVAEALTGWSDEEARGRQLSEVFRIVHEETRAEVKNAVNRVLREGIVVGLANHTLLIARDGMERSIVNSAAPIRADDGTLSGVVLVFRDSSEERTSQRLMQIRLDLMAYAGTHTLDELLQKALDDVSAFVYSPVGFYHFVEDDQKTLSLQQWSTRTLKEFCRAEGRGLHYGIEEAGVWADCVRERRPVIHNDYDSLSGKKGMPEGHAGVIRELVVPVMWKEKVVAILGVGNKPVDYTEKDVDTVSYLADVTWHIIEQKRAEEALHQSREKFSSMVDNIGIGVSLISPDMEILELNRQMRSWFPGIDLGKRPLCYRAFNNPPREGVCDYCPTVKTIRDGGVHEAVTQTPQAGGVRNYRVVSSPIFDGTGRVVSAIEMVEDVTEKLTLENKLRQTQKMESIGRLVGGVAHDYNNILSVILGYTEMAMEKSGPAHPLYADLQVIFKAAKRSADITRQLLAFARKQTVAPKVLDLNETVEGMLKMLRHLIGEDIDLAWLPETGLWPVKMDPTQIDQILANLCINARDAITGVGKVTIETDNVVFDAAYCVDNVGFSIGEYVLLAISDDGSGMNKEILDKIFEPFFTTKEVGRGTGLGLATVYGIVKQNNGFINVYSEPGKGSTFRIYLPRHTQPAVAAQMESLTDTPRGSGETVLVVEDAPMILEMTKSILERLGYRVLTAAAPGEAVTLAGKYPGGVHLLMTDVVMPEMNGQDLAKKLMALYPDLKCLFMSGYTTDVITHRGILDEGVHFIQKPFSIKDLAVKVRMALAPEAGRRSL
jgi:two-component system, cell cycle sensor histidine kinase and response regulator CckA